MSQEVSEHFLYVTSLEEANAEMRVMIEARNSTLRSLSVENSNLKDALLRSRNLNTEYASELNLLRGLWRVIQASGNEVRAALGLPPPIQRPAISPAPTEELHDEAAPMPPNSFAQPRHRVRSTEPAR